MVDFQERDTSRTKRSADETDDEEGETNATQASGSDSTPGATIKPDDEGGEESHDHHHHDVETVRAAVVTVSSTRSLDEDDAGDAIQSAVEANGDELATRDLVRDDFDNIQAAIDALVGREDVDVVITTGGTGVTPDDVTVEAVRPLFEKELPGFGELFRRLSYDDIGTKVVGSRATAGVADGVPVFCLPGSEDAARLGTEEIILEQAGHLAGLARHEE
jgi:molybdenum cofactor biosynthesis protein B